jgi:hypothetical protein
MRISFFSLHSLNKTLLKTNLLLPCQCWPVIMDMQGVRLSFAAFSLNDNGAGRPIAGGSAGLMHAVGEAILVRIMAGRGQP